MLNLARLMIVSLQMKKIQKLLPFARILHSVEHARDHGLSLLLTKKAYEFTSSEDMKGKPIEEVSPFLFSTAKAKNWKNNRV